MNLLALYLLLIPVPETPGPIEFTEHEILPIVEVVDSKFYVSYQDLVQLDTDRTQIRIMPYALTVLLIIILSLLTMMPNDNQPYTRQFR